MINDLGIILRHVCSARLPNEYPSQPLATTFILASTEAEQHPPRQHTSYTAARAGGIWRQSRPEASRRPPINRSASVAMLGGVSQLTKTVESQR